MGLKYYVTVRKKLSPLVFQRGRCGFGKPRPGISDEALDCFIVRL